MMASDQHPLKSIPCLLSPSVSHAWEEGVVDFAWRRVRLFDENACLVLFEACQDQPIARVTSIVTKNKSKWRPLPLDTVVG